MAQRTMQLGATGIWTSKLDNFPAAQTQEAVAELEDSAGADHVCMQVLTEDPKTLPFREYRELASAIPRN